MTFNPNRTKIVPELLSGKHQAQYHDADLGMWVDLGDAKDTRAEAQALINSRIGEADLPEGYRWAEEMEMDRSDAIVVKRTFDSTGVRYTQDEADLAVPVEPGTCEAYNTVNQGMCNARLSPLGDCPRSHEHGDHLADR